MIDKYLERGDVFALFDDELVSICVVTDEGNGIFELKNIATYAKYQGKGYGKKLVNHILKLYRSKGNTMIVGTGDSPKVLSFYEDCGFMISHRIDNFFIENYDHPMFEDGKQLIDMVYLKQDMHPISE